MSFLDFCLHCDTQTTGGAYCSQRCRLLDMDSSPSLTSTFSPLSDRRGSCASASSNGMMGTGFFLPPPFDFSAYRTPSHSTSSSTNTLQGNNSAGAPRSTTSSRPSSLYSLPGQSTSGRSATNNGQGGSISPNASRSSLQDAWSTMSRSAREELRDYGNSFDTVRDLRRRITTG